MASPHQSTQEGSVDKAKKVLAGQTLTAKEYEGLVKALKAEQRFSFAREILARARDERAVGDKETWFRQQHALCTYKDEDLPVFDRLLRAEDILCDHEDPASTRNQETLGLLGAIHKRRWEADLRKEHLETALEFYSRGHAEGPAGDQGYNGINAAYLLDLLAHLDEDGRDKVTALGDDLRAKARAIRLELAGALPGLRDEESTSWVKDQWFYYATVAEAHFGLGNYDQAEDWLKKAEAEGVDADQWERRTSALQFANTDRIRRAHQARLTGATAPSAQDLFDSESPEVKVLRLVTASSTDEQLSASSAEAALSAYVGRVGLALSGGGFRASLYHIGVLARLAELDVLRHVEVLSCVSGGSILGAHYYLEVRHLLQSKPEAEITRQDYIDVVKRLEKDFLVGVQENVRVRVASSFWKNLLMVFKKGYSRTHRVGELYEECLYSRVEDGAGDRPRYMTDLFVRPKDDPAFNLKTENWRRKAKVPDLVLNATTLNTGHNWQFTASWMGEPPGAIDSTVSGITRLRRMYYREAPGGHTKVPLGTAVGASSCVPGLFEPVTLEGLYPDQVIRLVDGGVHDNQGTVALLERQCRVLLISDASGQMGLVEDPSISLLGPVLRTNSILQTRVREEQFDEVDSRVAAGHLKGAMIVHLKSDLDPDPSDWVDCLLPHDVLEDARPARRRGPMTEYGVLKSVQTALAGVRTDLDSFHDVESHALMTSGYRMTEKYFDSAEIDMPANRKAPTDEQGNWTRFGDWDFLRVEPAMVGAVSPKPLLGVLSVSGQLAFKAWRLDPVLKVLSTVLKAAGVVVGAWAAWRFWDASWGFEPVKWIVGFLIGTAAAAVIGKRLLGIAQFRSTLRGWAKKVAIALGGFVLAKLHLSVFDPLFLKAGKVERVLGAANRKPESGPELPD